MSTLLHDAAAPVALPATSSAARRTGIALSALAALFLAFDLGVKLVVAKAAVDATLPLGWSASLLPTLGVIELACLVLYLVPRTAPIGAVLWIGYLGGAIAAHLRVGNPLFSHVLFPTYVAALLWGGLYLRDARVRALFGAERRAPAA